MRDALRTCLQIAGGLTEATRRRAVGAAKELLDQTGIDVDAVQRSIGERIPPEVQTLADELMASGRANRDLLVGLIREEIDKAMSRVGRLADEVTKVGVVLEALERRIRNLEDDDREPAWADVTDDEPDPGMYVPPQPPVEHAPVDGQAPASAPAPGRKPARKPEPTGAAGVTPVARKNAAPAHPPTASEASEASEAPAAQEPVGTAGAGAVPVARKNAAPAKAPAPKKAAPAARKTAPAKKAAPARTAAPAKKAAASGTGTGSTAKKAAPAARKTAAATPAKKTAPAAKKATPATAPAKKTAAASRTSAPAPAKKTAATKSTAKTAAPARKAAPAKKTAARSQEAKGRD
ncbi:histone [Streptomyces sp. PA03-3a]|nr:histone [Streptomyces sp. PA03-3a]